MKKEDIEDFVNSNVIVFLKVGWKYSGFITKISNDCITLDDLKVGKIVIEIDDISTVRELGA